MANPCDYPFRPQPPVSRQIPWTPAPTAQFPSVSEPVGRTVFISIATCTSQKTRRFLAEFGSAFIARHVGVSDKYDFIDSSDPGYVMRRTREKHIVIPG